MSGPAMRAGPLQIAPQNSDRSAQMSLEKRDGLCPRLFRMLRMMRRAVIAHEAVVGILVEHDLRLLARGLQRIAELVDLGNRNECVLAAEERQHRRFQP